MNCWMKLWFAMCMSVVLTACSFGNGRICGPQTPMAYCDKEAYQKLMHPKPLYAFWEKYDMTIDGRRQDWLECGGSSNGNYSVSARLPGETDDFAGATRGFNKLQRCMLKKSYHYTGSCNNKIMQATPGCGAP